MLTRTRRAFVITAVLMPVPFIMAGWALIVWLPR